RDRNDHFVTCRPRAIGQVPLFNESLKPMERIMASLLPRWRFAPHLRHSSPANLKSPNHPIPNQQVPPPTNVGGSLLAGLGYADCIPLDVGGSAGDKGPRRAAFVDSIYSRVVT